jgi:NADH:ubiquinone oxidoreductase subunit C
VGSVLARRDRALTPEEQAALLTDRLGEGAVLGTTEEFATFTLHVAPDRWVEVVERCRDEPDLAYDLFDCLFGIDAREDGLDVVCILYATSTGNRIALRVRCEGGREAPSLPTVTHLFRGADWMERETWDMFGIDFPGHPRIGPRLLTVENFEGWPLRKDFYLTSRVVKPWPGVKEPAELDEDGNVIERTPRLGDAPGPFELDKAMAEQAKLANPLPEPATPAGEVAEADVVTADRAVDSGQVIAGDEAQAAELDQEVTETADVQEAAATEADQAEAAAEDPATTAKRAADDARRAQADARARKAEERQAEAEARGADAAGVDPTSAEPATGGEASDDGGAAEGDTTPQADTPGQDPLTEASSEGADPVDPDAADEGEGRR